MYIYVRTQNTYITYVPSSSSPNAPINETRGLFTLPNILLIASADPTDAA
jgi:hypothetical protein